MNNAPVPLPHSIDSEKALLCSLVTNPYEVEDIIRSRLTAESFYIPAHRILYEAFAEMLAERMPIDFVTTRERLKAMNLFEEVGEADGLNEIWGFVPTAAKRERRNSSHRCHPHGLYKERGNMAFLLCCRELRNVMWTSDNIRTLQYCSRRITQVQPFNIDSCR